MMSELPDKESPRVAEGKKSSQWGIVKKDVVEGDTKKKLSVQERMLELRRRKQDRVMAKKEEQVAAGMAIVNVVDGLAKPQAATSSGATWEGQQQGSTLMKSAEEDVVFPPFTTVPRWEEYFAGLAADVLDGETLTHSQDAMLRVHSAYATALDDLGTQTQAPPTMWSVDDVNKYTKMLENGNRQLSPMESSMLEVVKIMKSSMKAKDDQISELEDDLSQAREELDDPFRQVTSSDAANQKAIASSTHEAGEGDEPYVNEFAVRKSMREDLSEQLQRELSVADNDIARLEKKIEKNNDHLRITRGMALQNACRMVRIGYIERGFRYWTGWWLRGTMQKGWDDEIAAIQAAGGISPEPDTPREVNPVNVEELGSPKMRPSLMGGEEDMKAATRPGSKGEFERCYHRNMEVIHKADQNRMRRMAQGIDEDSEDEPHDDSDEEINALVATEEVGAVGSLISYLAYMKAKEKNDQWLRMFQRMFSNWHVSEISRLAWSFGLWRQVRLRNSNYNRGQEIKGLKEKLGDTTEKLSSKTTQFDEFRMGRVGTYIIDDRLDMDEDAGVDDDYIQLVAYTRRMNQNWTKERLVRGIDSAGWVLGRSFWCHLSAIFYGWRMNVHRLKLLAQKFSLFELDKLELQAEATQAQDILGDQEKANGDLEETVTRLKAELAKLRREKAWIERYAGRG